jgi:basic membrane protein A
MKMKKDTFGRSWVLPVIVVIVAVVIVAGVFIAISLQPSGAPAKEKLKVGVVMWGFHDEGVWDTNAWEQLQDLAKIYPIEIGCAEEVDMVKLESTLRSMVKEYDIIWAHSSSYEDAVKRVATDNPNVYFLVEYALDRGKDYYPQNVVVIGQDPQEALFLLGALAAKMSTTQKFGVIQAINDPLDTIYSNGFRDGVLYVNPNATVSRVIMEAYLDPVKTRDSVRAFAEAGCDVVFVSMDDESGSLEAQARGIYSCQHYKDITSIAPNTILNNAIWNYKPVLEGMINAIMNGKWLEYRNAHWFTHLTLKEGTCGLGTYGNMVPQSVKDYIESLKNKIIAGEIVVTPKMEW